MGDRAARLCEEYDRLPAEPAPHEPLTFDQVEEIWRRDMLPRLKGFACMKDLRPGQQAPPKESRWYAQWRISEPS